jgi:hypothetical protein
MFRTLLSTLALFGFGAVASAGELDKEAAKSNAAPAAVAATTTNSPAVGTELDKESPQDAYHHHGGWGGGWGHRGWGGGWGGYGYRGWGGGWGGYGYRSFGGFYRPYYSGFGFFRPYYGYGYPRFGVSIGIGGFGGYGYPCYW